MAGSSLIGSVPKGTVKGITEKLNILGYKKIIVASFLIIFIHLILEMFCWLPKSLLLLNSRLIKDCRGENTSGATHDI